MIGKELGRSKTCGQSVLLTILTAGLLLGAAATAAAEEERDDPFVVPAGSAGELLTYIEEIQQMRPPLGGLFGISAFRQRVYEAQREAAERILAAEAETEQREAAARYLLEALEGLQRLGDDSAAEALAGLPEKLEEWGLEEMVREVERSALQSRLAGIPTASVEEVEGLLDEVADFLRAGPLQPADVSLALMAARGSEPVGDGEVAAAAYRRFAEIIAEADDPALAGQANRLEGTARRLTLLGEPMHVAGKTVEGEPLDWEALRGKVVLVDFWATWCGPCLAEIPKLEALYEDYHDRGFEIVAISIDQDRSALERFLEERPLSWIVLHDARNGEEASMAEYYGIMSIPTMILVDEEGRAVSLRARGAELDRLLAEHLGPRENEYED